MSDEELENLIKFCITKMLDVNFNYPNSNYFKSIKNGHTTTSEIETSGIKIKLIIEKAED